MDRPVKRSKHALRAAATRRTIIDAARACFLEQGYLSTTIKDIAGRAGVAPQTVYFVFRNKVSILAAVLDVTIAGDDAEVPIKNRPWVASLRSVPGPRQAAALLAGEGGAIVVRTAPLFRVLLQASADPDVAALLADNKRQRGETLDLFAGAVAAAGWLTDERQGRRFADVLYAVLSEECYRLLVEERGWTATAWQSWVAELLCRHLTDASPP
jgi:AcrR family transcriptional regulator